MKQAGRKDKKRVLEILTKTFDQVQGIQWLVKGDDKKEKKLWPLPTIPSKKLMPVGVYSFRMTKPEWHFATAIIPNAISSQIVGMKLSSCSMLSAFSGYQL
jgi:hypothetical protein